MSKSEPKPPERLDPQSYEVIKQLVKLHGPFLVVGAATEAAWELEMFGPDMRFGLVPTGRVYGYG